MGTTTSILRPRITGALVWALGAAAALVLGCRSPQPTAPERASAAAPDFAQRTNGGLGTRAANRGLFYGVATSSGMLLGDPAFAAAVLAEATSLTPEWEMKWEALRPTATTFDFAKADAFVGFATSHGMAVHGHALVWHEARPAWFDSAVTERTAERLLQTHIATVVGRYAGRVQTWDVVNEAIDAEGGRPDGLRDTPWLRLLGPGYVTTAFRAAHAADPNATLVLNDFGLEYNTEWSLRRRAAVLQLVRKLRAENVPIHALGVQAHLNGGWMQQWYDARSFSAFMDSASALGLRVIVTEMDVDDRAFPTPVATRDSLVASIYSALLDPALRHRAVTGVTTWGLTDRSTWLTAYAPRADGQPVRTLPLDAALARKPAWRAIAAAIEARPPSRKCRSAGC